MKRIILVEVVLVVLFSFMVYGVTMGQEKEDVGLSPKKRTAILRGIKEVSLSVTVDSLAKVDVEGSIAKTYTIPSNEVPKQQQEVAKWIRGILENALEKNGYKIVTAEKHSDAEVSAQYTEKFVIALGGRGMFLFDLMVTLNHPQYGELFSTTISDQATKDQTTESKIAYAKMSGIIGVAPSEKIKNIILSNLKNALPFK